MNTPELLLGWLLGLLSPLIVDGIKGKYDKKELFLFVKSEFKSIQYRLVCNSYILGEKYGKFDRGFLEWCLSYFNNYPEIVGQVTISALDKLLEMDDDEFAKNHFLQRKSEEHLGLSLKTIKTHFLDSKIHCISTFNINLQSIILSLKTEIELLNEETEWQIKQHFMTFDNISNLNLSLIKEDMKKRGVNLQNMSTSLVENIDNLLNYNAKI